MHVKVTFLIENYINVGQVKLQMFVKTNCTETE
jgi:hypothetical protein